MNVALDPQYPPVVQQLVKELQLPRPTTSRIILQDPGVFCNAARELHVTRVLKATERRHVELDDNMFADDDVSLPQYSAILEQATVMQESSLTAHSTSMLPEVINMLFILLREIYPRHEFCSSVTYATAKPLLAGVFPILHLHGQAALIVRKIGTLPPTPLTDSIGTLSSPITLRVHSSPSEIGDTDSEGDDSSEQSSSDSSSDSDSGVHSWWYRDEPAPGEDLSDDDEASLCDGHDQQLLCSADHEVQEPTVLCVDLTDSIETLLASALYHRSSLGLDEVLIGIACDRTSTVVRVIIGWLDEDVEVGDDLPKLHRTSLSSDMDAFDLSNPMDAVALLIVLRRMRDVRGIEAASLDLEVLPWRADLHSRLELLWDQEDGMDNTSANRSRVEQWAYRVQISSRPSDRLHTNHPNEGALMVPEPQETSPGTERSAGDSDGCGDQNGSSSAALYYARVGEAPTRMRIYLFCHRGIVCSVQDPKRFEPVVIFPDVYVHASALVSFSDGLESVSNVCLSPQMSSIIHDLREAYETSTRENAFLGNMRPVIEKVVRDSFCSILHVVEISRALRDCINEQITDNTNEELASKVKNHNEAAYRHIWDQLMQSIVTSCRKVDVRYEREAILSLSENPLVLRKEAREDSLSAFAALYPAVSADTDQYGAEAYKSWNKVDDALETASAEEFDQEPMRGKADSIITIVIPSAYRTAAVAKSVSIWTPTRGFQPRTPDVLGLQPVSCADPRGSLMDSVFVDNHPRQTFTETDREAYREAASDCGTVPVLTGAMHGLHTSPSKDEGTRRLAGANQALSAGTTAPSQEAASDRDLHIPLFAAEFGKNVTSETATYKSRMHLLAMASFLRLFGIFRFPLFGLVTTGSAGAITCAWSDTFSAVEDLRNLREEAIPLAMVDYDAFLKLVEQKRRYADVDVTMLADQHATILDLTNPLDALNVTTFIAYVVLEHAPRIRALFSPDLQPKSDSEAKYLCEQTHDSNTVRPIEVAQKMTAEDGAKWKKQKVAKPNDEESKFEPAA